MEMFWKFTEEGEKRTFGSRLLIYLVHSAHFISLVRPNDDKQLFVPSKGPFIDPEVEEEDCEGITESEGSSEAHGTKLLINHNGSSVAGC